jgi:hypothetical protein
MLAIALACEFPAYWYAFAVKKEIVGRLMQRKRALETMLATLTEDVR